MNKLHSQEIHRQQKVRVIVLQIRQIYFIESFLKSIVAFKKWMLTLWGKSRRVLGPPNQNCFGCNRLLDFITQSCIAVLSCWKTVRTIVRPKKDTSDDTENAERTDLIIPKQWDGCNVHIFKLSDVPLELRQRIIFKT